MARRVTNRTLMTITHTGTGAYDVSGAQVENGFKSWFASLGAGSHDIWFVVSDLNDWEAGRGVYSTTTDTITRDVIFDSSFGPGTPVNWPAGNKFIFMDIPADWFEWLAVDFNLSQQEPHNITANVGMAFGLGNTVGGLYGAALGRNTQALGNQTLTQGRECIANAENSVAMGYRSQADWNSSLVLAGGRRVNEGDRQGGLVTPSVSTTNATETDLNFSGNFWTPLNNKALVLTGNVAAYQYGGGSGSVGDIHGWGVRGVFNDLGLIGSLTVDDLGGDAATSAWAVQASTSGLGVISVTGEANKDINWSGSFLFAEAG